MSLEQGTRIGVYEIVAKLGEGGLGAVYRARDTTLKRQVAIKVPPEAMATDADRLKRFQREAEEFRHQIRGALVRADVVDGEDVRVIEGAGGLRLDGEAAYAIVVSREVGTEDFDRHVAPETRITRTIHLAHASSPDGTDQLIRTQSTAWGQSHARVG